MADANSSESRPSARKTARSKGEKTYIGKPCPNGHDGIRYTKSGGCLACGAERAKSEKKKAYDAIRNERLRNDIAAKGKARYLSKRAEKIEYTRRWAQRNPDKRQAIAQNYKHRRRAQEEGGISSADLAAWKKAQPKVCHWCGKKCARDYTVDHYLPLAKGGKHEADNFVIACRACNVSKNAKLPEEFAASLGRLL